MTYAYFKGHKAEYDYEKQDWFYCDDGASATQNERPCKKCGKHSIKEKGLKIDACLGNFGDNVVSACCGHGVKKGYILFDDGRMFEEVLE